MAIRSPKPLDQSSLRLTADGVPEQQSPSRGPWVARAGAEPSIGLTESSNGC